MPPHTGPAQDFERFLENSSETEINQWAVRTFVDDHKVVVWLIRELRRLRARVEELEARKGR